MRLDKSYPFAEWVGTNESIENRIISSFKTHYYVEYI